MRTLINRYRRFATGALIGGCLGLGIGIGSLTGAIINDVYSQDTYPCTEDEVLGFAPRFGPDKVGCIHIDELSITVTDTQGNNL